METKYLWRPLTSADNNEDFLPRGQGEELPFLWESETNKATALNSPAQVVLEEAS